MGNSRYLPSVATTVMGYGIETEVVEGRRFQNMNMIHKFCCRRLRSLKTLEPHLKDSYEVYETIIIDTRSFSLYYCIGRSNQNRSITS